MSILSRGGPVRCFFSFLMLVVYLIVTEGPAYAQQKPRLLDINGFMVKGVFTELDPELVKHRLSLQEIVTGHLDGKSTDITHVLGFMASQEKMRHGLKSLWRCAERSR